MVLESEHEETGDSDSSDEVIDVNELQNRMWSDRMLLQWLNALEGKEVFDSPKQGQYEEQARRKKMYGAHEGFLITC